MTRRSDISGGIGLLIVAAVGYFVIPGREIAGFDLTVLCYILAAAGAVWLGLAVAFEVMAHRNPNSLHVYDGD